MRRVEVVPYNHQWPEEFAAEAQRITGALSQPLLFLHHIGSTAVRGLAAKPIIDLLGVVSNLGAWEREDGVLKSLGYRALGEHGITGRRFYQKGGIQPTHHLHVYPVGHPEIASHLAFRDYLRAFPDEAAVYGALKQRLALQYPHDIQAYMKGKHGWIQEAGQRAEDWWGVVPVVVITGALGVGKTTTAEAVAAQLEAAGVAYWLMDVDRLTDFWPRSPGDSFGGGISQAGLAALWPVMRSGGTRVVILPRVIESADEGGRLAHAISGGLLLVVRLRARPDTLRRRILCRAGGQDASWELQRAQELTAGLAACVRSRSAMPSLRM
ncbi:GrpB family protein [Sulfobacillus harzensis]|uniref:GrpB family protein n=1 Tax=Sulfobacillus harzensis TaxID=2729629 RepID=UPI001A9BD70A|nr:GrpB family protein [Sulfobacillus harzensis]